MCVGEKTAKALTDYNSVYDIEDQVVEPLKRQIHELKVQNQKLNKKLESRRKYRGGTN